MSEYVQDERHQERYRPLREEPACDQQGMGHQGAGPNLSGESNRRRAGGEGYQS